MSINKKDRCLFGNKEEQLRIYNQRRTINRLEKENKQLKEKFNKLKDEMIKDRMEQFDDYVIYLLTKYIDMIEE